MLVRKPTLHAALGVIPKNAEHTHLGLMRPLRPRDANIPKCLVSNLDFLLGSELVRVERVHTVLLGA